MSSEPTFQNVVSYFNDQQWDEIAGLLDDTVIVKKVDDPDSVGPKKTLMNYLRGMQERPKMYSGNYSVNSVAPKTEIICGEGRYQDDINTKKGEAMERFAYSFTFTQDNTGKWLLVNVWAALLNEDGSIKKPEKEDDES